jgi:hypothetical protein
MSKYRVLQLTNQTVGTIAVDELMPLGNITRRIQESCGNCSTFNVTTSQADTVYLNEVGNYNITFSASLIAGSVGEVSVALFANGTQVYEVGATATAIGDVVNLTLPYQVRVCPNCASSPNNCPVAIQVKLTGVAITGGQTNLLVERVY